MVNFKKLIKALIFDYRLKRAKKKALKLCKKTHCKYLVLVMDKKPVAISMKQVRQLIKQKRLRRGITADNVRKLALFECL